MTWFLLTVIGAVCIYLAHRVLAFGLKQSQTPLQEKTQHPLLTSLEPRYVMVQPAAVIPEVQEQIEASAMWQAVHHTPHGHGWVLLHGYQTDAQGQEKRN